ncbi:hypothetical protein S7335_190 [Synechococcus sp. PCC 7335]|nr:hypothetical protein S7335_190 [Synechococcus sp. PCC 7335]
MDVIAKRSIKQYFLEGNVSNFISVSVTCLMSWSGRTVFV